MTYWHTPIILTIPNTQSHLYRESIGHQHKQRQFIHFPLFPWSLRLNKHTFNSSSSQIFPLYSFPLTFFFMFALFFITWKQPNHKDSTHKLHQTASLCPQPTCALQWRIFSTLHFTGYEQTTITFLPWLNINSTKGTMWISILLPFIPLGRFSYPISTCACLCILLLNLQ